MTRAATGLPTLQEFYSEDRRRLHSPEVDFGVRWRSATSIWPLYRISWIEATGEVYAIQLGGGIGRDTVIVLGTAPDRAAVDAALKGWEDVCGEPNGLLWVRERLFEAERQR